MGKSKDRKQKDNLEQPDTNIVPRKEKKRKRDVEETEIAISKKSKSDGLDNVAVEDAPMEDVPIDDTKKSKKRKSSGAEAPAELDESKDGKKSKKDKKDKKEKKSKKSKDDVNGVAQENGTSNGALEKDGMLDDFIAFEEDPSGKFELPTTSKRNKIPLEEKRAAKAIRKAAEKEAKEAEKSARAEAKAARKAAKRAAAATEASPAESSDEVPTEQQNGVSEDATDAAPEGKKDRFIVFVGNLPFTATKEQIQTHFAKVEPIEIRLMTEKDTQKPKGFAFIEFDRFDKMETCLKKYQHSVFADGKKGRKINVELTAGGGGNTSARLDKIQAKNNKLQDERQRDREKKEEIEAKQSERKEKKQSRNKKDAGEEAVEGSSDEPAEEVNAIHPARLAMMNQPEQQNNWQQSGGFQGQSGGFNKGQRGGRGGGRGRGRGRGKRF